MVAYAYCHERTLTQVLAYAFFFVCECECGWYAWLQANPFLFNFTPNKGRPRAQLCIPSFFFTFQVAPTCMSHTTMRSIIVNEGCTVVCGCRCYNESMIGLRTNENERLTWDKGNQMKISTSSIGIIGESRTTLKRLAWPHSKEHLELP